MLRSLPPFLRGFRLSCRRYPDTSPSAGPAAISHRRQDHRQISDLQLRSTKTQKQAPPNAQHEEMETNVIDLLKQNPPMRQHFLNRIAGPVVNKMFECGMIP
jgi:hypothetical protein